MESSFRTSVQVPWQVGEHGGAIRLWLIAYSTVFELEVSTHELLQIILGDSLDSYGFFKPTETLAPHKSFLENVERVQECVVDPRVVGLGFAVVAAEGYLKWLPSEDEAELSFQWKLQEP